MNASVFFPLVVVSCVLGASEGPRGLPSQFTMVSWNVESRVADPHVAAARIAEMHGVHLWGLCGVRDARWARLFQVAAGENEQNEMIQVLSPTRVGNRSLILYDAVRFDLVRHFEFDWKDEPWYKPDIILQPSLVAQLRHHATGQQFLFMVNCLNPDWAARQAEKISRWAEVQGLPIIAAGTYYFQYNLGPQPLRCDGQMGLWMLSKGPFYWIRPRSLVKTYDSPFNTVEDFIFLANATGILIGESRIVVRPDDFVGRDPTGAHRPVKAAFMFVKADREAMLRRQIIEQILKLQEGVDELEALVRKLPD